MFNKCLVNANQFKAWLRNQGCTFETKRGTGHIVVRLGDKKTVLPMHGGNKELGKGLVEHIKKQLGLK
ncbi:MAG: type II toxin-antitoxin system HicA family toxin [Syntrophobacteraceae bacterium]